MPPVCCLCLSLQLATGPDGVDQMDGLILCLGWYKLNGRYLHKIHDLLCPRIEENEKVIERIEAKIEAAATLGSEGMCSKHVAHRGVPWE